MVNVAKAKVIVSIYFFPRDKFDVFTGSPLTAIFWYCKLLFIEISILLGRNVFRLGCCTLRIDLVGWYWVKHGFCNFIMR